MDAYPEVLLVGVSPLVLAVNAIPPAAATNATTRSLFDRFLDALACMDDERNSAGQEATKKSRTVSLFRPHNSSDEEDDSDSSDEEEEDGRRGGFGAFGGGRNRRPRSAAPGRNSSTSSASTVRTTVAQALDRGQGFFQRARIQAVSHRHAFPPSKDPDGSRNWTAALRASASDHDSFFAQHPVTGILPAGWLEKHVNAMPSVLVVVCTVCGSQELQAESDAFLYATVEHLAFSLVAKRRCQIHVVGLMEESLSPLQAEGWSRAILDRLLYQADEEDGGSPQASAANPLVRLTLLNTTSDLEASAAVAQPAPLQDLYTKVRHDCGAYYGAQVRRCRTKLRLLREATASSTASSASHLPPPPLLPLWIRYTFKMAIFYEFQWKHRKSLRYLAESYQYAVAYYQYLEQRQELASPHASPESSPRRHARAVVADDHVEVALASPTVDWTKQVNDPPDDMIYQCRQVADWLSFKLTSAALESHTLTGLGAANDQWRQHGRVFLIPQAVIPAWYDWAYIGRQRIVMSQLVERHMPRVLATTTEVIPEEWLLRCSPWRVMESVVEALLRLSREVDLARQGLDEVSKSSSGETSDLHRAPFVGGLDSHGLTPLLLEECRKNPRETALQMVLRAITLFEQELEREKRGFYAEDSFAESSSSRTGARLYYLAGGILLGQKRHQEAAGHLEKAVKLSKGWPGLELAVRKMLIECYETHVPTNRDSSESSLTLASMILDSYFNAEMSSGDLRRALGHFASMSGGQSVLKWYRECFNDEDSALPFTFEVTFPENIFATVGDCVKASILLKSNLDYGVHVNSLVLLSLAGDLPIASMDMMRAKNASEGIDGGIIIQRNGEIIITTELVLPKDLSSIAFDEGGNGGELQGVSGKGSFAKSARPRTAAMTSAAGARMLSADQLPPENQNAQGWSMRFLGGKPLKCDGVRMVFYPVQAEKASRGGGEDITPIELTIEKKKARTEANIRRTPFEEENYIASAWSRPQIFPLSHGPRSLRVLSPRAEMVVTNMTDPLTDGKAIEGTVNRVLLKLQAGPREECSDIKYNVSCFSVLMSPEGVTKRLVPENELAESETSVDMSNAAYRTPTMVSRDESSRFATASSGYQVPVGWSVSGNGQGFAGEPLPKLKGSEACYVPLDFFRPSADLGDATSSDLCKTDFYVTVVYKQERPASKKRVTRARRTARRRPVARPGRGRGTGGKEEQSHQEDSTATTAGETSDTADISDEVSLEYSGTILWGRPVSASFEQGAIQGYPSGKLHPSNSLTAETSTHEISLIHGERTTQKCILQAAEQDLKVELVAARFEGTKDPFQTALLSGKNGTVYEADSRDPSRILSGSSKFSLVYSVRTNLSENTPGPVTGSLGTLNVDWLPRPLELPFEVSSDGKLGGVTGQGPLALEKQASSVRFSCPPCHVERAPFSASLSVDPPIPKLGQGFDVRYRVENRTNLQQTVTVHWSDHEETPTLLVSGLMEGSLTLGPGESQTVAYTAVALVSGHIKLPAASLISTKFKTRVVNDEFRHAVFVQP